MIWDSLLRRRGDVTLVGTVHTSPESRRDVIETVSNVRPDHVAIELDAERFTRLWNDKRPSFRNLRSWRVRDVALFVTLALTQRLAFDDELKPGEADMLPAAETAREIGATVSLIDQTSETTMRALSDSIFSSTALSRTVTRFRTSAEREALWKTVDDADAIFNRLGFDGSEFAPDLHPSMASDEDIADLAAVMTRLLPGPAEAMLHERNAYMAGRIHWLRSQGRSVVGVVGWAHKPGIQALLENSSEIPEKYVVEPDYVRFEEQ